MFDVGFAELFVLALIGLLVLGPERLPRVARTVGGFVRKARASWISLRNTIQSELDAADISAPIKQAGEELKKVGAELKGADISAPFKQTSEELKKVGKDLSDMADFKPEKTGSSTVKPDTETDKKQQETQDSAVTRDDDV